MLDKIKDASKILFIIGVVLYTFGFITISSFWGRFGIITFDIINARFLIAGFFSLFSIAVSFTLAWYVYKKAPFKVFFNPEKWSSRLLGLFTIYGFLYGVAGLLTSFLNLGSYQPPATETALEFHNFTRFDFIGTVIKEYVHLGGGGYDYVTKLTFEIFSYIFLLVLLGTACVIIYGWFLKKPKTVKVTPDDQLQPTADKITTQAEVVQKKPLNKYRYFLMINAEIFAICGFIALFVFCSIKLTTGFIDFSTIQNEPKLSANLYFSWLYVLVIGIYLFLNFSFKEGEFNLSLFTKIENINNYDNLVRQVIIPVFSAAVIFGWTIYPRIPFAFGGGQPREIQLHLINPLSSDSDSKVYLLGESSQFIFVAIVGKNNSEALQINKDQIEYIQTKTVSKQD